MSFEDDMYTELGEIFNGEFSEPVTIKVGVKTADLNCIFNKTYAEIDADGIPVQSNAPMLGIDKFAADIKLGTELIEGSDSYATVKGVKYRIKRVEPNGTGYAQVFLKNPVA